MNSFLPGFIPLLDRQKNQIKSNYLPIKFSFREKDMKLYVNNFIKTVFNVII